MDANTVIRLYPAPQREFAVKDLYLRPPSAGAWDGERPLVYTSFIASLDGRIAIEQPVTGERGVPQSITNPRDWRLYQELAARADVLLVSARFARELARGTAQDSLPVSSDPAFADLRTWRARQGLRPQPPIVILTASLDLPLAELCAALKRRVYVATGEEGDAGAVRDLARNDVQVLHVGAGAQVDGGRLVAQLVAEGFKRIYSIAGPGVLETLLRARVLDRIYLTQVHRLIGGTSYDTLLEGSLMRPPADFVLEALYYDGGAGAECGQFFSIYELISSPAESQPAGPN